MGSTVDARYGEVYLQSANGPTTQSGAFAGGVFKVRQDRSGVTDLYLRGGNFRRCRRARSHGAHHLHAARNRRHAGRAQVGHQGFVRGLWGSDNHGRFRTHGHDSVATVRGTVWLTADRCNGTLVFVRQGRVLVSDRHRHRRYLLSAGQSHLAHSR